MTKEIHAVCAIIVVPELLNKIIQRDLYIVQKRGVHTGHYPGWYGTFGGKIEPGDADSKATLFRELKEELGWQPNPDEVVHLGDFGGAYPQPNIFPTFYTHAMLGMWYCPMMREDYQKIRDGKDGMGVFEGEDAMSYSWGGLTSMQNVTYPVIMGAYLHRQWKQLQK